MATTTCAQSPFAERRARLEELLARRRAARLPDARHRRTSTIAREWFERFEGAGLDGVVAKRLDGAYQPGVRAMAKIKHLRTADCVVGGLRWYKGEPETAVGSLLLGLYDDDGVLHHVGHTSSFKADEKRALADDLRPYISDDDERRLRRGPHAGLAEPLDGRQRPELGATPPRTGLRGHLRPPARQALPSRRHLQALAHRQAAAGLHLRPD